MSQLAIDQLPDLCLRKIFSYFGLRDLTSSRAVCRLFKFYADQAKVHELVVIWNDIDISQFFPISQLFPNYTKTRPSTCPDNIISMKAFKSLKTSQFGPHQQVHSLDIYLEYSRGWSIFTKMIFVQKCQKSALECYSRFWHKSGLPLSVLIFLAFLHKCSGKNAKSSLIE